METIGNAQSVIVVLPACNCGNGAPGAVCPFGGKQYKRIIPQQYRCGHPDCLDLSHLYGDIFDPDHSFRLFLAHSKYRSPDEKPVYAPVAYSSFPDSTYLFGTAQVPS